MSKKNTTHSLKYLQVLEEYKESPQYRANKTLQAIAEKIRKWFHEGSFSKQNVKLTYLERSDIDKGLQNTMDARFQDKTNTYTVTAVIMTADVIAGDASTMHVKVKRYDVKSAELVNSVDEDIAPSDFTEDYLLNKVADVNKEKDLDVDTTAEPEAADDAPLDLSDPAAAPADDAAAPSDEEKKQDDSEGLTV